MTDVSEVANLLKPFKDSFEYYAPRALRVKPKAPDSMSVVAGSQIGLRPFIMNRAQTYLHNRIEAQKRKTGKVRVLGLKGRQQGFSTYIQGRYYWTTSLTFGTRTEILTHEQKATDNIFAIAERFHNNCPPALRPHTKKANAKELVFDLLDSTYGVSTAGTKNVGRSGNAQLFHGSEVAFWPNDTEHMAGLGQTIADAPGTEVILETTGNGEGNMFHGMWMDAERGIGDYISVFVPYFWQEEYQLPVPPDFVMDAEESEYATAYGVPTGCMVWRRNKLNGELRGDLSLFDQEYPAAPHLAFRRRKLESFVSSEMVWAARKQTNVDSLGVKIMGVDPAEYGDDDTCICYRQGRNGRAYAGTNSNGYDRFHGLGTMEVVGRVAIQADKWKPDFINVDSGGIGSGVADRLIELGYPVNRINFGERAVQNELYVLRKDEIYGEAKKWLQDLPNQLPDDDAFQTDATGPTYTYDSSRRLKIESKEKMKSRGLKSDDGWEAFCLTHAILVSPGSIKDRNALRNRPKPNWRA